VKACGACGRAVRKLSRAFVIGRGMSNVCRECESYGVIVVAPRAPVVRKEVVRSSDDVERALKAIRTYRRLCDDDRRAEGLDQAIAVLERGRSS
jgi:hypothetical protein